DGLESGSWGGCHQTALACRGRWTAADAADSHAASTGRASDAAGMAARRIQSSRGEGSRLAALRLGRSTSRPVTVSFCNSIDWRRLPMYLIRVFTFSLQLAPAS